MREISTDQGKFKIRDSIKELPIDRFSEFQRYLIQDSGMGSSIEDVAKHFEKLDIFLASKKIDEAILERNNLHFNLYLILNKVNITHLTFATLVDSIDEMPVTDYSEQALLRVCDKLGKINVNREQVEAILEDVKKKVNSQLENYFPEEFDRSDPNHYQRLKDKALLEIRFIRSGDYKLIPTINDFTDYQISLLQPQDFNPGTPSNPIRSMELSFESLCTNLEELGVSNPKKLTVFEFYSKIRYFKAKNRP